VSEAAPDVLDRLIGGKDPISLLAELTDKQLDSVPAKVNRFADGHHAAHLVAVKRAVA
jgi:hypothetical protein